jgi:anti-anti-sigma factor
MNTTMTRTNEIILSTPSEFIELVRGNEDRLVALMAPVVREQGAVLDMAQVRRIDAAGIAALISIYGCARDAGHTFRVCNVTPHVAEILKLVGLDHILVTREEVWARHPEPCLECPAA